MPGSNLNSSVRLVCCWVLLCCMPGIGGAAVPDKAQTPVPRIEIPVPVREGAHALEGQTLTGTFTLVNTGAAVLHIREIKTGCTCIRAEGPDQVPPGGRAELRLTVDTKGMPGERAFKATVASDDPARPVVSVTLKARITPLVTLTPDRFFLRGPVGRPLAGDIDIVNRGDESLRITIDPLPPDTGLTVELTTIVPGKHLRLSLLCPGGEAAAIRERLMLHTTIPGRERIVVPVLVDLLSPVEILPAALVLRRDRCPACPSRYSGSFLLRATDGRPLTLLAIRPEQPEMQYETETLLPQQAYRITVYWDAASKAAPPSSLTVTVRQNEPQTLSLPVRLDAAGEKTARIGVSGAGN